MDFYIPWFEQLNFGDYSILDKCSYGLLHSLIRTAPFRWLLSIRHMIIWTFAFADSNCLNSVNIKDWTHAHMDFCNRWFDLLYFGDYSALDTCSYRHLHPMIPNAPFRWPLSTGQLLKWTFALAETNCSIPVTTQHWTRLISTFAFYDSNCTISVTTQHWTPAHMDFCFRW
jgi:hypothetical protein